MRAVIAPTTTAGGAEPISATAWSAIGSCILLLVVLIVGAFYGTFAALATALGLFLACGAAGVLLVVHDYPPEDLED